MRAIADLPWRGVEMRRDGQTRPSPRSLARGNFQSEKWPPRRLFCSVLDVVFPSLYAPRTSRPSADMISTLEPQSGKIER